MALSWFRRNQKGMLIVFGVLLMAVFGLPQVFFSMTPAGGGNAEQMETIVKYSGGAYTRGEFQELRYQHAQAIRFVEELQRASMERVGRENFRPRAQMLNVINTSGTPQQLDRQVMQRLILLIRAKDIGMKVGDDAVLDYLRAVCSDEDLTERILTQFAFELFRDKADYVVVREQLKQELVIQQMYAVVSSGFPKSPNITEAWEDFLKLNRRRAVTILEYPVEKYVDKVTGEPGLPELRKMFAEGEYDYPDITRQKPGFKSRRKIRTVVLSGNFDDFMASAEAAVKPEEIEKLYNEYAELKHSTVMENVPKPPVVETPDDGDAPPEFNLDGDEDSDPGKEDVTGNEEAAGTESGDDESSAGKSVEESSDDDSKEGESDDGGSGDDENGIPLNGPSPAGLNQEEKQEENEAGSNEQQQSGQDDKESTNVDESVSQDEAGSDDQAAADDPDKKANQIEPAGPELPSGVIAPANPLGDGLIDDLIPDVERRVKPLDEELSNILRREIARVPAANAMRNAINEGAADISDYGSDLTAYELTKDGPREEREPKPEPLDLQALAKKYKLQIQETDLLDLAELAEHPGGKISVTIQQNFYGQMIPRPVPLSDYIFANYYQLTEFQPETVVEHNSDNQHIVFVKEKADPVVRSFDEAKDDVIEYWRYQQAIELAKADARKLADEISESGQQLVERFPANARDVTEFSWHTQGELYPTLLASSTEDGIQTCADFMETTFGLEVGKSGVAEDATRENVYVIQVNAVDSRTEEELRELFFNELTANQGISRGLSGLYLTDWEDFQRKWFTDIENELEVKWLAH